MKGAISVMMGGWGHGSFGGMMNGRMPGGMMSGDFWWMGLIGMVIQLLFWDVIVVIAIRLFKKLHSRSHPNETRAIDILRERYAKGEIDTDEFNRRKTELQR